MQFLLVTELSKLYIWYKFWRLSSWYWGNIGIARWKNEIRNAWPRRYISDHLYVKVIIVKRFIFATNWTTEKKKVTHKKNQQQYQITQKEKMMLTLYYHLILPKVLAQIMIKNTNCADWVIIQWEMSELVWFLLLTLFPMYTGHDRVLFLILTFKGEKLLARSPWD